MSASAPNISDVPELLPSQLGAMLEHWRELRRGENDMPFADDVELSRLPGGPSRAMLLGVFEGPRRFRLDHLGRDIAVRLGSDITGKFVDEIELRGPLDDLSAHATAVVERRAPCYYRHSADYCRILLPTWGDGRVSLLIGAVARTP